MVIHNTDKEMKCKIKIFVASHKPDKVYHDNVYTPIHVGRSISRYKDEMADMIGDNTGDNISEKNPTYCELTATYWAWKNLKDVDYVGLAHYRRYFETKFTEDNIDSIFNSCDVILAKPYLHDRYMEFKLIREVLQEDEAILLSVIKKLYPDYEHDVIDYLYDFVDYPFNMFVMRRSMFEGYCDFLFSILFECEKIMHSLPYTCASRRFGYIAEFLLPIFCFHNKLRVKTEYVVPFVGEQANHPCDWNQRLKVKLLHKIYDKHKPSFFEQMYDNAVIVGLRNDGIEL